MTNFAHQDRIDPVHIEILNRYCEELPVKVGALAKELGLRVVEAALALNISGLIQPEDDGSGFVIKVNRFEPKERQRFTIAHEIAHYLLHKNLIRNGVVDSILYRSMLSSRIEAEANRLAADIVMPRNKIRDYVSDSTHGPTEQRVAELASIFNVSKQAMDIRLGS